MHRNNFQQAVEDGDHYANMGMEWRENSLSIDEMIREAGRKMYEEKRADNFLAVLVSRLRGVYFVGLSTDSIRSIYILEYFKEILKTAGGQEGAGAEIPIESRSPNSA